MVYHTMVEGLLAKQVDLETIEVCDEKFLHSHGDCGNVNKGESMNFFQKLSIKTKKEGFSEKYIEIFCLRYKSSSYDENSREK